MKIRKGLLLLLCVLMASFSMVQCEKGRHAATSDEDSDKPAWAGGRTDLNPHKKGNKGNGKDNTQEYGDLLVILRDDNGVPILAQKDSPEEGTIYVVQPIDADGNLLDINDEGELLDPTQGIEVEFGRLNIVRSPQSVLDQGFNEAMKTLEVADDIVLDACGRLTAIKDGVVKTIDSPRESLAIYQYLMQNKPIEDLSGGRLDFLYTKFGFETMELAPSCIAAGSDKSGYLIIDEIVYINSFIDCIGVSPILNPNEFDKQGKVKQYFDFSDYTYNRKATYMHKKVVFKVWDGVYYGGPAEDGRNVKSIYDVMMGNTTIEYVVPDDYGFTNKEGDTFKQVKGFTTAADDAVQVLDFIHEDSNIEEYPTIQ